MAEPREDKIAEELKHTLDAQTAITAQAAARTQSDLDTQPQPLATVGDLDKAGDASKDEVFRSPSKEEMGKQFEQAEKTRLSWWGTNLEEEKKRLSGDQDTSENTDKQPQPSPNDDDATTSTSGTSDCSIDTRD